MLSNEKYRGDVRLHNPMSKETDIMMKEACPPIISAEIFESVQEEKKRRSNVVSDESGVRRKDRKYSSKRKENTNG